MMKMRNIHVLTEKPYNFLLFFSFAVIFVGAFLLLIYSKDFTLPIILHFDKFNGIDFFGETSQIWGIYISVLFFVILNAFLAEFFFFRERILSLMFLGVGNVLSVILLIVISLIIAVN